MEKKSSVLPWILVVALLGLFGWGYWAGHRPVAEQLQQKEVALAKATGDVERANATANQAKGELDKAQEELKQARTDLSKSAAQQDADSKLLDELKKQVGNADVQGQNGQITVTLVDKVLFKSGEADLSADGEQTLNRLGAVLKNVDKLIEVAGHADNQAVKSEIRELYPTNWELSTARATNVVRFLQEVVGLNGRRLKAAGYGPYRPVASNASEKGRAKNRRIEILLLPNKIKVQKGDFAEELAAADDQRKSGPAAGSGPEKTAPAKKKIGDKEKLIAAKKRK